MVRSDVTPSEASRRREEVVEAFEEAWRRGERPSVREYCSADGEQRTPLLLELVHVDPELRLKAGEAARVEDYLRDFPELAADTDPLLTLLAHEHELRRRRESDLLPAEYQQRFPHLADQLTTRLASDGPVGRYQPMRLHARGGLGEVHVARDLELNRDVALKRMAAWVGDDPESRSRFLREAEVTADLQHPGIVPVYGLTHDSAGRPCYAMRFIEGESLQDAIQTLHSPGPVEPTARDRALRQLLGRFVAVCNAVAYANSKGVLHRDLKPANIMLGCFGETLVLDWGLARPTDKETGRQGDKEKEGPSGSLSPCLPVSLSAGLPGLTRTGAVLGTPAYMSPEQAAGDWDHVGPASDVFSLGATLYALLTGRPPFAGSDVLAVLQAARDSDFLPPRHLEPRVPFALDAICCKAMARRPEDRYDSALDLAADVERWLADEPTSAARDPLTVRLARLARRNRTRVVALGVLLITALVASVVGLVLVRREQLRTDSALVRVEREKRTARLHLYAAHMHLAGQAWDGDDVPRVLDLLRRQQPQSDADDLRGFEWYYLWRLCHSEMHTFRGHEGHVNDVAFSPDRGTLVTGGEDGTVRFWDLRDGPERTAVHAHDKGVTCVAFSPDGRTLATGGADQTIRLSDANGAERRTLRGHQGEVTSVAFDPTGGLLASGSRDGTVKLWDVATGALQATLSGEHEQVTCVAFSPAGGLLAAAGHSAGARHTVKLWDVAKRTPTVTLRGHTVGINTVAFAPNGLTVASGSWDNSVRLWEVFTGRELANLNTHGGIYTLAFSPDGRSFATGGADNVVRLWDVAGRRSTAAFKGHTDSVRSVQFSADGNRLASASADGTAKLWEVGSPPGPALLRGHTQQVQDAAFAPDGRTVATTGFDGTIRLWDVRLQAQRALFSGHEGGVNAIAISPDGGTLASGGFDKAVRLWDLRSGEELAALKGHQRPINRVAFTRNGRALFSSDGSFDEPAGDVWTWDVADRSGRAVTSDLKSAAYALALSPDGKTVAVGCFNRTLQLCDATTGETRATLQGHTNAVVAAAFSPDGSLLATASWDATVRLWNLDGSQRAVLKGHPEGVLCLAFTPDGRALVSGGGDDTLRVWDLETLEERAALQGPDRSQGLAFSPDGRTLVSTSGGQQGNVRLWRGATDDDVAAGAVRRDAADVVAELYRRHLLNAEVIEALRADTTLNAGLRDDAIRLATVRLEDAAKLSDAAWDAAKRPGAEAAVLARALRQAEAAFRLEPRTWECVSSLGVVQYRLGKYREALETLTKAIQAGTRRWEGPNPVDVAFLAMTHHHLGDSEKARQHLAQLRQMLKEPKWTSGKEAPRLAREAEALIDGGPGK